MTGELAARTVLVLAAGEGKRMKSATPKVLHPLLGRSLLGHVLAAAQPLEAARTLVVIGRGAEQVEQHLAEIAPDAETVLQAEQLGTGHAVRTALAAVPDLTGTLVVLNGDVPLLRPETLQALIQEHEQAGAAATVLTAEVDDPYGLGRIVLDEHGGLAAIVEHRDATPEQRAIREINAGIYAFDVALLRDALEKLSSDNDQGEQYLTDVFGMLRADGRRVTTHRAYEQIEALGCNDRAELAQLRRLLQQRVNTAWMREGVTMDDPDTTWIDVTVRLARDVHLRPNTILEGATEIAEGAQVGPDATLIDTAVGERATVLRAHSVEAEIGPECSVGPYSYLRPGTRLARKVKIGTYVETKKADIGEGTKVPHLTYVGDATIGEGTNIGAANVFVNYDGIAKHHTVVGSHVRTGSDTMLVAPIEIGDGAYTAAGSIITEDVPPGALAVARARQRNIEGWVERRREGTPSAEAAKRAKESQATDDAPGSSDKNHPDVRAEGESGDTDTARGGPVN